VPSCASSRTSDGVSPIQLVGVCGLLRLAEERGRVLAVEGVGIPSTRGRSARSAWSESATALIAVHYSFQKGGTRQPRLTSADAPTLASSDEFPMKFVSSKLVERAGVLQQGPGPYSPSHSPSSSSTRPSSSACPSAALASRYALAPMRPQSGRPTLCEHSEWRIDKGMGGQRARLAAWW
jgi:hypothetical protein